MTLSVSGARRQSVVQPFSPFGTTERLMRSGLPLALGLTLATILAASLTAGDARAEPMAGTVNCATASKPAEFEICNSEALLIADDNLARLQAGIENNARTRPQRQVLARSHDQWLRERDSCGADQTCLALRYDARISELKSGQALRPVASSGFVRFGQKGDRG